MFLVSLQTNDQAFRSHLVWYDMRVKNQEASVHTAHSSFAVDEFLDPQDVIIFENTPFYDAQILQKHFGHSLNDT